MDVDFESSLNKISVSLKRFIHYKVNDEDLIDDLYQEIIYQAWKKYDSLNDKVRFKKWIFQIASNKIKDYYRKKYKNNCIFIEFDEIQHSRFPNRIWKEELITKEEVNSVLEKIKIKYKEILEMFYIKELTLNEISDQLSIPIGTVKSRLYYAKRRFREVYNSLFNKEVGNVSNEIMFPKIMPEITITKLNTEPFIVDYKQVTWWFFEPVEGYNCMWASYDYPEKTLDSISKMEYQGRAIIHDIDCVEFSSVDYNKKIKKWDHNRYRMYARLTDTHVQWVAQTYFRNDHIKVFRSFLDEGFAEDFGNIDSIKGNERLIKDEGKYEEHEDGSFSIKELNNSGGCGFYSVIIDGKEYTCLRVIESDGQILVETYISKEGKTILFRRYNSILWGADCGWGDVPWNERLPNNHKLVIDDITYVHWYDCITDFVIKN